MIIDENTTVIVQGITGRHGAFHTRQMLAYGTKVVAGVSPGKGGQVVEGVPVYDTVGAAVENHEVDASVIFIPAAFAKDAALEAIDFGIKIIVIITEHIPVHDELEAVSFAQKRGAIIIGPNTFGIVSPGRCKIGIPSNKLFTSGPVGVAARSGTLTYEIVANLTAAGLGQSTVIGLGGDRVVGLSFRDVFELFESDPETKVIVLVGEIGGSSEEDASAYIRELSKPVIAYIAGRSAPPGKRMGHAGAIIEKGNGTYEGKVKALQKAGVEVAKLPFEIPQLVKKVLA